MNTKANGSLQITKSADFTSIMFTIEYLQPSHNWHGWHKINTLQLGFAHVFLLYANVIIINKHTEDRKLYHGPKESIIVLFLYKKSSGKVLLI